MKRKITVTASSASMKLNSLPEDNIAVLTALGFQEVNTFSGLYIILDDKDIIFYDDNSATYGRVIGGALNDNGQTFLKYVNEKDGWEIFLEDFSELDIQYHGDLAEVFEASSANVII